MAVHITTEEQFADLLEKGKKEKKPVFVKFSANWCGPCKVIQPEFDKLANLFPTIGYFCCVDVDELQDISQTFKIRNLPTFLVIVETTLKDSWTGADVMTLKKKIRSYLKQ